MSNLTVVSRNLELALEAFAKELHSLCPEGKQYSFSASSQKEDYGLNGPKMVYSVSGVYGTDSCRGNTCEATVEEYFRRQGWNQAHEPMVLIAQQEPKTLSVDDDIPF